MTVIQFQHTAARRRLDGLGGGNGSGKKGFNTQPPEGGWLVSKLLYLAFLNVSTHSRPKAAGL